MPNKCIVTTSLVKSIEHGVSQEIQCAVGPQLKKCTFRAPIEVSFLGALCSPRSRTPCPQFISNVYAYHSLFVRSFQRHLHFR